MSSKELKAKEALNENAAELDPEDLDQVTGGSALDHLNGVVQVKGGVPDTGNDQGLIQQPGVARLNGIGRALSRGGNA